MNKLVKVMKPFGFFDYNHLQKQAFCCLFDSGPIGEESAILGFPAITLRTAIERPEVLDCGSLMITGYDPETVLSAIDITVTDFDNHADADIPGEYNITNVSQRVVKLITGTCRLSKPWDGIWKT